MSTGKARCAGSLWTATFPADAMLAAISPQLGNGLTKADSLATEDGHASASPAFEIPPQVLYREVDGQMVLLNLETEQYFGLNEVGAHIVTRLTQRPFDEALAALTDDFEVDPSVLHRDVDDLVRELLQAGLLKPPGASA